MLVGLVNVVVGQGAQEVLQAWDIVIVDGMDDSFHHKGVFLIQSIIASGNTHVTSGQE